jgi:hypothetical protein
MRIVTGHATNPRIAAVPPAIEDSIRLISQVVLATLLWHEQSFFKTDVASAAEFLTQLIRFQLRRIKYLQVFPACLDGDHMFFTGPMTTLTGNSSHQMIEL